VVPSKLKDGAVRVFDTDAWIVCIIQTYIYTYIYGVYISGASVGFPEMLGVATVTYIALHGLYSGVLLQLSPVH
jgi:hypothetical protein